MKLLQISLKPPYPKVDGGCVAIAAMTESLLMANHQVKVLTMETHKHPFEHDKVPSDILSSTEMESVKMDTQIKSIDALLNLFSSKSYNVERFFNEDFAAKLSSILKEETFDVVHLESIFCAPYLETIRAHSKAKIVVRTHNVEFEIWQQLAKNQGNPIKRWYLNLLSSRLKNFELDVLNKIDGIVAITQDDANRFRQLGINVPIEVIPIGMDVGKIDVNPIQSNELKFYHLGAMDWVPNVEAVEWFIDKVWPKLNETFPNVTCHFAGRKMPVSLLSKANGNLSIQGEVESVSGFISDKNVAIIPILSGSGMRVKIIEALAHGKVVITTGLGATGIEYEDGKNLLIANTPNEFVEQVEFLSKNMNQLSSIGEAARKLSENKYKLENLSSKLTYFYGKL